MYASVETELNARPLRIALAVSQYHAEITAALRDGAVETFIEAGGLEQNLLLVPAAGAFELTAVCRALARHGRHDALVAIGCVITGQTRHDRYICRSVVQGLTQVLVESGVPIGFGLLTCRTMDQARARAGGAVGNKGVEAMAAAIASANTLSSLLRLPERP
jgi:6,7-dimethyl-8-ribityllumazine synthase